MSEDVLEGLARALQLDEAEHAHLFDLVRSANVTASGSPSDTRARPSERPADPRRYDRGTRLRSQPAPRHAMQ